MNGPQDLGGKMGFGAINPEPDEPLFHAGWEARALGVTLAAGGLGAWTLDESRHARESLPWPVYLGASYYEIWIRALENLLVRHGLVAPDELATGEAAPAAPHPRRLAAEAVAQTLARGSPSARDLAMPPRFDVGQRVIARNIHPAGHTRLPAYVRGHPGTITASHGGFVLPDAHAHGRGEAPQPLYSVRFDAADLWGPDAEPGSSVTIDAWESYLEPA